MSPDGKPVMTVTNEGGKSVVAKHKSGEDAMEMSGVDPPMIPSPKAVRVPALCGFCDCRVGLCHLLLCCRYFPLLMLTCCLCCVASLPTLFATPRRVFLCSPPPSCLHSVCLSSSCTEPACLCLRVRLVGCEQCGCQGCGSSPRTRGHFPGAAEHLL